MYFLILYILDISKAKAKGSLLDTGEMVVFKGSKARLTETPSVARSTSFARKKFIDEGRLKEEDGFLILEKDTVFKSPSAATATFAGRSMNGWSAWKDKSGLTMDEKVRG